MIETIYIARHGFRLNWVNTNWKSVTGLPRDPPLAAYGETQAQELADYFLSLPAEQRPTAVFSSPYYRCLQTAKPTSEALNLPIYVEHGLSEWYSPAAPGTGLHPRPAPAAELQAYFPTIDPVWSSLWHPSRRGEDLPQLHARTAGVLGALIPEIEARFPGAKRVLLVSHAATVIALARALLGEPALPLRVGCCSLTEVVRREGAETGTGRGTVGVLGGWRALRLVDGAHLKEGASRDWGFEDIVIANGKVIDDVGVPGTENEAEDTAGPQQRSSL
ncbi:histidine phosphatase superfamily [Hygrophoropsis aurantiaca]|uniref:Histidine phosphatase superfamily n=1 Tax=Hygrophoropsis aurantiaca TaxID=72124 RepID=A0ACB8AR73_9AGAM|nr:histidine phosphatase superfamily [Hygrophoropsis aurantiaca]